MNIVTWFQSNWIDVANVVAYTIAAASILVKLTPNKKDDEILGKIIKFVSKYIALNK